MTPEQVQQIVRQEVAASAASAQFKVNRVEFHTHNGKDSPFIYLPTISYAGLVNSDGTQNRLYPFPSGWGSSTSATGIYTVRHSLNTLYYSVGICPIASSAPPAFFISSILENTFTVKFWDSLLQTALATAFYFTLTHVTNTKPGWPLYNKNAT